MSSAKTTTKMNVEGFSYTKAIHLHSVRTFGVHVYFSGGLFTLRIVAYATI